jgi:hypothetical protein
METKLCKSCDTEKPLNEMVKNNGCKDGYRSKCKKCRNAHEKERMKDPERKAKESQRGKDKYAKNKVKHLKITKKYYNENLEWRKDLHHRKTYGITMDDKILLRKLQINRCRICNKEFESDKTAYVDHCHSTKIVRGLLCHHCNSGIGYLKDNVEYMVEAIAYLRRRRNSI